MEQSTIDQFGFLLFYKLSVELRAIIGIHDSGNHIHTIRKLRRLGRIDCLEEIFL